LLLKEAGSLIQGMEDRELNYINVIK
jgi:hypothetical protein